MKKLLLSSSLIFILNMILCVTSAMTQNLPEEKLKFIQAMLSEINSTSEISLQNNASQIEGIKIMISKNEIEKIATEKQSQLLDSLFFQSSSTYFDHKSQVEKSKDNHLNPEKIITLEKELEYLDNQTSEINLKKNIASELIKQEEDSIIHLTSLLDSLTKKRALIKKSLENINNLSDKYLRENNELDYVLFSNETTQYFNVVQMYANPEWRTLPNPGGMIYYQSVGDRLTNAKGPRMLNNPTPTKEEIAPGYYYVWSVRKGTDGKEIFFGINDPPRVIKLSTIQVTVQE